VTSEVAQDTNPDTARWYARLPEVLGAARRSRMRRERGGFGLSAKLLLLTVLFVMLAEILIFVPSIANFRVTWLMDRLTAAQLASLAAEAVPGGVVPDTLRSELLRTAQVRAVALKRSDQRRLVLPEDMPTSIDGTYDFRQSIRTGGTWEEVMVRHNLIRDALAVFFAPEGRVIRVIGQPNMSAGDFIEIVLPEAPLRAAMLRYGFNVLGLSIIISMITAALVYFTLNSLLVQPMMRLTRSMLHFSENPEDTTRIIAPSLRSDEIGTAERELAHMQGELAQLLHQKSRLAALGLAVSKINHDLRNMLANAQLISDRLTSLADPGVQHLAPKLIQSIDRAINFCNDTLRFGRAEEAQPRRELVDLYALAVDVGDGLGLPRPGAIDWTVLIDPALRIDADKDQMYRVLTNLARNAAQAIDARKPPVPGEIVLTSRREQRLVIIEVADNGPGIPDHIRDRLFQPFQASTRKGGSGLGLAIARELLVAHGGRITLVEAPQGTTFRIELPDRGRPPDRARSDAKAQA
jgi:signal transduction histidine kinase